MKNKNIIKSSQFNRETLDELLHWTNVIERNYNSGVFKNYFANLMRGKILATLFYEPSTRTRLSFESAMIRLGGSVITTENAKEFSSAAKGENIEDTIRVVQSYADCIVIRHYEEGSVERASSVSNVPIINAGDGPGEHPSQSLIDLYTIQKELGKIDEISIAMVGDLANGRTVRSLCYLLANYKNIKIYFVSPEVVRIKDDIKKFLSDNGVQYYEETDLKKVSKHVDVIYQTRIQKERLSLEEYNMALGHYIIDSNILNLMKQNSIIMHPLPRLEEISPEVDHDRRAAYFRQSKNGLFVRASILKYLLV